MTAINIGKPSLVALRLAEESACAGYLVARRAMVTLAAREASVSQMLRERPGRADYLAALKKLVSDRVDAQERTRLAYRRWQRAQVFADTVWTTSTSNTAQAA